MADLNINVDYEYAPGEAGKTSYVTISDAKLIAMGYTPELGKEKQALCVYNLNVGEGGASGGGSISDGLDSGLLASVLDLPTTNPLTVAMVDANGDQITTTNPLAIIPVDENGLFISTIDGIGNYDTSAFINLDGSVAADTSSVFAVETKVRVKSYETDNWIKINGTAVDSEGMLLFATEDLHLVIPIGGTISTIGGKLNIVPLV